MPIYTLPFGDVPTGAVKDVYTTIAALIVPDVAGNRCKIIGINAGSDDDVPADHPISFRLARIADVSAGTAGTASATVTGGNMAKTDPNSVNSIISGKVGYTVGNEPTTFENKPVWEQPINDRSGFIK